MTSGGKRLNELIRKYGFRLGAVAEAIEVDSRTMRRWTDNAPIGKLIKLSEFTHIPMAEVIDCFRSHPDLIDTDPDAIDPDRSTLPAKDRSGGENN